jgi:hypothetical protein
MPNTSQGTASATRTRATLRAWHCRDIRKIGCFGQRTTQCNNSRPAIKSGRPKSAEVLRSS